MNVVVPQGWEKTRLENLIVYVIGGDWGKAPELSENNYKNVYCIRGAEFRNWDEDKGVTASLRVVKETSLANRKLEENDILVEISGGGPDQPVGRTVLIDKVSLSLNVDAPKISTNFLRLMRPSKLINSKYLNYYLNFFYRSGEIVKYQAGSNNLRNLKFKDYIGIDIPVPSLDQQNRIVQKIEELLSELDKGIESLKTAREQLKVYRQALLKHAFEGKLTEQWRKDNADKLETADELLARIQQEREDRYQLQMDEWQVSVEEWKNKGSEGKKPSKPSELVAFQYVKKEANENLPNGWVWTKFVNLIEYVTSGSRGWAKYYSETGSVFIRAQNLKHDRLDLEDIAYVELPKTVEGKRTLTKKNDLLITITGANVTKTAYVKHEIDEAYVSQHVALCRLVNDKLVNYLYMFLIAGTAGRKQLEKSAYGAGKPGLNLENIKDLILPIASAEECDEIATLLDNHSSVLDHLDSDLSDQLSKSESLRQSILKKAFSGKLVPQDPNDEPASELLKRIAQEKADREVELKAEKESAKKAKKKTTTTKNKASKKVKTV